MKLLQVRLRGGPKFSISVRKFNLKKVKLGNGIEVKNTETRFGGDGQVFLSNKSSPIGIAPRC